MPWPQPAVLRNTLRSSSSTSKDDDGEGKESKKYRVLALYKFVSPLLPTSSLPEMKLEFENICRQYSARGTVLLAAEGINGTLCYPCTDDGNDELLFFFQKRFHRSLRIRISAADQPIFARLKVRVKSEIVTMQWNGDKVQKKRKNINSTDDDDDDDDDDVDDNDDDKDCNNVGRKIATGQTCGPCCPTTQVGEYVSPREWNKLLLDPNTLVIDTRNKYEIEVGTFHNSINPHTQSFIEFPAWLQKNVIDDNNITGNGGSNEKRSGAKKKIAMFCTGGIRCEKATNICLQLIPKNNNISVYHLEGGILAYLDEFADKKEESLFEGDCYVFDQRVAVSYGNKPSTIFQEKCHACRHPLSCDDIKRDDFVKGLSCKYCVGTISEKQREKFIQRQKQMELALENGKQHIYDPKEKKSLHCHKKVCVKRSDE